MGVLVDVFHSTSDCDINGPLTKIHNYYPPHISYGKR
jgi:hypothetical protein